MTSSPPSAPLRGCRDRASRGDRETVLRRLASAGVTTIARKDSTTPDAPIDGSLPEETTRLFTGGDVLITRTDASKVSLELRSPFEKASWKVRIPESQTRALFPGTPLLYEGNYYEIVNCAPGPDGVGISYYLIPWDDQLLLRQPQVLDEEHLVRLAEDYAASTRPAPPLYSLPLYGSLPRVDQERLESERGISPLLGTAGSAIMILALTMPICVTAILFISDPHGFGADHPGLAWTRTTALVWFYFFAESLARLLISLGWETASGTLPVVLGVGIPRAVRHHRLAARRAAEGERTRGPDPRELFGAVDRVRRLSATEATEQLEVLSRLPKPDWVVGFRPIHFDGAYYDLCREDQLGSGSTKHYRFLLEPLIDEVLTRDPIDYEPSETGRRARDLVRAARSPWITTLAVLWGYLPEGAQRQLEVNFDYEPEASTRLNVRLTLGFAALTCIVALFHWSGPNSTPLDPLLFVACLYLLWETARRRRRLSQGQLEGSVLGRLLEPLARHLLRDL